MDVKKFQKIHFNQTLSCLNALVSEASASIEAEDIKEAQWDIVRSIELHKPTYLLINLTNLLAPVTPDIQDWITAHIIPKIFELGVQKIGYVMPKEIIANISVEQLGEEVEEKTRASEQDLSINYFADTQEAIRWFLGKPEYIIKDIWK